MLSEDPAQNRASLLALARLVLSERAEAWMSSPIPILGMVIPNTLASTRDGAQEVQDVLQQIRFGIF